MQVCPWPAPATLQNQPAEHIFGGATARIPRSRGPWCALQGGSHFGGRARTAQAWYRVNRAAGASGRHGASWAHLGRIFWSIFWRLPGATSGHRLLWHRRQGHPAPDRAGRPSAWCRLEFGAQEFHENLPTRRDPTGIFISLVLAWFSPGWGSGGGGTTTLRGGWGTAGAIAGFTAESTTTAGRKPRLEATIITPGKPVPASGEQFALTYG
jgi:hypothetical protein